MFDDLRQKIDGLLRLAVAGAIAAAAGVVAFFCFAVALFLWMQQNYGTLEAWLALGALFVTIAAIAVIVSMVVRSRAARQKRVRPREEPSMVARVMQDPAMLLAGVQVLRLIGARNVLPVVLLGAVAGGLLMGRNGGHAARADRESDQETQYAADPAE